MSSKHLLLLILSLVVLAASALADYAKPTGLGKRRRPPHTPPSRAPPPPLRHTSLQGPGAPAPPRGPEAPVPTPELLKKLFPGRHNHGFMLHHRPGPEGPMPQLFKRPIRGRHNPPPSVKPTSPPRWDPPPFAMPPPPPLEPGSLGPAPDLSEKLFPGRRRSLLAHASFMNHGHHPAHPLVPHHGYHYGAHPPMEYSKGPHICRLLVIPPEFNI